jgi:hypothetical protein
VRDDLVSALESVPAKAVQSHCELEPTEVVSWVRLGAHAFLLLLLPICQLGRFRAQEFDQWGSSKQRCDLRYNPHASAYVHLHPRKARLWMHTLPDASFAEFVSQMISPAAGVSLI